ncbi:MAG: UbiD family decarboxylase, partial [Clostridiales bacterium]
SQKRIAGMIGGDENNIGEAWNRLEQNQIKPVLVENAPVQENIQTGADIDAGAFPWMQYYPTDAGRYVSSGIVVAKDAQ